MNSLLEEMNLVMDANNLFFFLEQILLSLIIIILKTTNSDFCGLDLCFLFLELSLDQPPDSNHESFLPWKNSKSKHFPLRIQSTPSIIIFFSITGGRYISLLSENLRAARQRYYLTCTKLMKEKQLAPVFQSQAQPLLSQLLFTIGNHKSRLPL